jgi:quinohemoprotein amine dehydrogenase
MAMPSALKAGNAGEVILVGTGLDGAVNFGPGTTAKVVSRDGSVIRVNVTVKPDAAPGARSVKVGKASGSGLFAIYSKVDRVQVEPGYAIGRVGGGKTDAVVAQFEAVGYLDGPADASGKKTEVRLGMLPAAWSVTPFNAQAEKDRDAQFAGSIDQKGRFTPAGAGPNPDRKFSTNNAGNLYVVARVKDGDREVEGKSHLIVTVQRWNTPPIY